MKRIVRVSDEAEHLRPIRIPPAVLARWIETAEWLAKVDHAVLREVRDLQRDRTFWRLGRCATAARWMAKTADEPYRGAARALAVEFEEAAQ